MSWLQYVIDFAAQRQDQLPMMDNVINRATDELASQRALLREATHILQRVEWHSRRCPICGRYRRMGGHAPDCQLDALLKRLENE